jgi:hypothetical protein
MATAMFAETENRQHSARLIPESRSYTLINITDAFISVSV